MQKKALVIIDIQNDITKNYKDVIGNINKAIDWAVNNNIHVIYIRHENLSAGTRTLKPNTCQVTHRHSHEDRRVTYKPTFSFEGVEYKVIA